MTTHETQFSVLASLFTDLPDVFVHVLRYLSTSERRCFAAVCCAARTLCNGMEKRIRLPSWSFVSEPLMPNRFPALAHLTWVEGTCSQQPPLDDERLLSHLANDKGLKGLQGLQSLNIAQCSHLSACAVTALLAMASKLEHLALGRWACTASILGFPLSLCVSLRSLDFGDDQVDVESIDDTALQVLSGLCTSLRKLSLSRCVTITDVGLGSLSTMRSLRELSISGCKGISQLPSLPALQVLDASHCCSLGDNALEGLAQGGTPFLKCLMLERCAITNAGLGVCGQMPHLERLDLGPSFEVTSAGLASLGRCRALQSLCFGNMVIQQEVQGMGPGTSSNGSSNSSSTTTSTTSSSSTNNSTSTRTASTTSSTTTNSSSTRITSTTSSREGCSDRSNPVDLLDTNLRRSSCACGCQHQGPREHRRDVACCSPCFPRACSIPGRGTEAGTAHADPCSCPQACSIPGRGTEADAIHAGPCSCPAPGASSRQAVHVPLNSAPCGQGPEPTLFLSLKKLQFGGSFFTCGLHMVFPIAPTASLTSLCIKGYSTVVGPHMVSIAKQNGIEHLELHGGYTLTPEDCLPLVKGLPRLRKLVFACCPLITAEAASHLLSVSRSNTLAVIELWRLGYTEGSGGDDTRQTHGCRREDVQEIIRS